MGAPVTAGAALDKILEAKTDDLAKAIQRLSYLHAHDARTLICYSISVPKLLRVLRSSQCANNEFLQKFDNILRDGFSKVLNVDLSHKQWIQATLPVNKGGVGIWSVVSLAPSAFLASAASTFTYKTVSSENLALIPDTSVTDILAIWCEFSNNQIVNESQKSSKKPGMTKSLIFYLRNRSTMCYSSWRQSKTFVRKRTTIKSLAIGLRLLDKATRISIDLRLGSNLCAPYVYTCAKFVNAKDLHSFSCKRSSVKIFRHDLLNDIILRAIQNAKILAKKHLWASVELMERDHIV